jgi:hypothetical protein
MNNKSILLSLSVGSVLVACLLSLISCGGGDDEPAQQTICLNCAGAGGNARLLCEMENARRAGC